MKEIILIVFILIVFVFFAIGRSSSSKPLLSSKPLPSSIPIRSQTFSAKTPPAEEVVQIEKEPKIDGFQVDYASMPPLPPRTNRRRTNVKFGENKEVRLYSKKTGKIIGERVEKV